MILNRTAVINDITVQTPTCSKLGGGCLSSVDVQTDQVEPHGVWSIGGTGGSISQIVIEIAGNAAANAFGIYDPFTMTTFQIYSGTQSAGTRSMISILDDGHIEFNLSMTGTQFTGNTFGFYLDGPGGTWYSQNALNSDGHQHMVGFEGTGTDIIKPCLAMGCSTGSTSKGTWLRNEYILAWEDLAYPGSDFDYNDFVVLVESVSSVPEPSTIALLGIGLLSISFYGRGRSRQKT